MRARSHCVCLASPQATIATLPTVATRPAVRSNLCSACSVPARGRKVSEAAQPPRVRVLWSRAVASPSAHSRRGHALLAKPPIGPAAPPEHGHPAGSRLVALCILIGTRARSLPLRPVVVGEPSRGAPSALGPEGGPALARERLAPLGAYGWVLEAA